MGDFILKKTFSTCSKLENIKKGVNRVEVPYHFQILLPSVLASCAKLVYDFSQQHLEVRGPWFFTFPETATNIDYADISFKVSYMRALMGVWYLLFG